MFGIRVLLVLIGIGLVIAILIHFGRGKRAVSEKKPGQVDKMVECQECGTYIPENEAIFVDGASFCCEQHRRDAETSD